MKILFFDLETAPNKAYVWSLWNELRSMDYVYSNWYVLCWSAKWLGNDTVFTAGIKSKRENDGRIMKGLWRLFDEADIVVAHNAVKFDVRRVNTRFIANGLKPPSPYKVVDTLLLARKHFAFTSNRLNDLAKFFKIGEKVDTGGFELWKECMNGNQRAWDKMIDYCAKDVTLLEKVYLKLRPYIKLPNMTVYEQNMNCPKCNSNKLNLRGYAYTNVGKYQRFVCKSCGSWGRVRKSLETTPVVGV